jgi:type IV secretion system protein VirB3
MARDPHRNQGLQADPLFVGLTRPAMKWGVTYSALMVNIVMTTEAFILTRNLWWLLAMVPIHGLLALVCLYEPRFFDLLQLWGRTRGLAQVFGNARFWRASAYSPLPLDLPDRRGRRKAAPSAIRI